MGVRFLNTLIKRKAPSALKYVSLSQYSGKTIVIDTSIYIHKYLASNSLMESMYFMISQFKYLNITPVFIFDGVAPAEKKGVLNARASVRENALEQYNRLDTLLHKSYETGDTSSSTSSATAGYSVDCGCECPEQIRRRMQSLKRRFIRISNFELNELKRLMREFGVEYIESDGESDLLCAYLVKCGFAQACMSDDMDLFLYGCPVVLRHVNIWHSTGVEYTLDTILRDMAVSLHGFKMVCILSGTDYTSNGGESDIDIESKQPTRHLKFRIYLSDLLKSYQEYQQQEEHREQQPRQFDTIFYDWVVERHKKQVSMNACDLQLSKATFEKAYSIFSCDPSSEMKQYVQNMRDTATRRTESNDNDPEYEVPHKVKRIMAKYNFIYI
jgi:5'-3' exonuclease